MRTARQVSCGMLSPRPRVDLLEPLPLDLLRRALEPGDRQLEILAGRRLRPARLTFRVTRDVFVPHESTSPRLGGVRNPKPSFSPRPAALSSLSDERDDSWWDSLRSAHPTT